jgi:hypothetical protein
MCLFGMAAVPLGARSQKNAPVDVTVILDFKGPYSQALINEMEREASHILSASGVRLGWSILGKNPSTHYNDLVVLRLLGSCRFEPAMAASEVRGLPYAVTWISDGEVQPFGEVYCDRVVSATRDAMSQGDYARGNQVVGRAMGRVLAHELMHMLTKSSEHGTEGVAQRALSGRQLTSGFLSFSAFDSDRLKLALGAR